MRLGPTIVATLGVFAAASLAALRATAGDPIPGADIYLEQDPTGEPIKVADCQRGGGQVHQRVTDRKWICDMTHRGPGAQGVPVGQAAAVFKDKTGTEHEEAGSVTVIRSAGPITIVKKIVVDSTIPPPNVPFPVAVRCQPGGPNTTVMLSSANGFHAAVAGVPAGSRCTIAEQVPAAPPDLAKRGCHWQASYPDIPGATTRTIINHWVCR